MPYAKRREKCCRWVCTATDPGVLIVDIPSVLAGGVCVGGVWGVCGVCGGGGVGWGWGWGGRSVCGGMCA